MKLLIKCLIALTIVACANSYAEDDALKLKLFRSGGIQQGKWQPEVLEGSDANVANMMKRAGNMSICMDMAKQIVKDYQHENSPTNKCTREVVNDSASTAEVDVTCESGTHIHSSLVRINDKTFTSEATITTKDKRERHMKVRYTYQGECTGDGVIQFDKDSQVCKAMQKKTQGADMSAMCTRLQGKMRETCEENMKNVQASCK